MLFVSLREKSDYLLFLQTMLKLKKALFCVVFRVPGAFWKEFIVWNSTPNISV